MILRYWSRLLARCCHWQRSLIISVEPQTKSLKKCFLLDVLLFKNIHVISTRGASLVRMSDGGLFIYFAALWCRFWRAAVSTAANSRMHLKARIMNRSRRTEKTEQRFEEKRKKRKKRCKTWVLYMRPTCFYSWLWGRRLRPALADNIIVVVHVTGTGLSWQLVTSGPRSLVQLCLHETRYRSRSIARIWGA